MKTDRDINAIVGLTRPAGWRAKGWIIAGAAGVIVIAAIAVFGVGRGGADKGLRFETRPVTRGDVVVKVTATGSLEPTNQVEVGSELSGIVRSVAVDYNDRVISGQVLATLDTANLEAAVAQSSAALESAQAEVRTAAAALEEARSDLERLQKAWDLSAGRVPSQQSLQAGRLAVSKAAAAAATARANVARSEAALTVDRTNLAKALIRSPINGIVLARSVEKGQTVAASLQAPVLFTLAENLTQMELHVDVDEADVGRVHEGQSATFTVDAYPDRVFPASISQVRYGAEENSGVVTYETVLAVDNSDLLLRPGMTATAEITVEAVRDTLRLPNAALRFSPEDGAAETAKAASGVMKALRPPRPASGQKPKEKVVTSTSGSRTVWRLVEGRPEPVAVETGVSDGTLTVVRGGAVEDGMELIVDTIKVAK